MELRFELQSIISLFQICHYYIVKNITKYGVENKGEILYGNHVWS